MTVQLLLSLSVYHMHSSNDHVMNGLKSHFGSSSWYPSDFMDGRFNQWSMESSGRKLSHPEKCERMENMNWKEYENDFIIIISRLWLWLNGKEKKCGTGGKSES